MAKLLIFIGLVLRSLLATAQTTESSRWLPISYQAQPLEQAMVTLMATNRVSPGGPVEYKANQSVVLLPGFQAKAGSVFTAHTGGVSALALPQSELSSLSIRAYPNPFEEVTIITYVLTRPGRTSLQINDAEGRLVSRLVDGRYEEAGRHSIEWKGSGMPTGTYMCILDAGPQRIAGRIIRK